ncbi:hypothetical protein BN946_scf185042.g6 [Trametes cinnabarina]|uniref:C-factor n=1 Tax=Pycnoporus cinnabarinus TaxID=5643 RepID=A0A060S9Y5_PYCCI|nr:hypothetical protein BN946_scf185042.g6 [Trametes cinnabarina]
MTVRRFPHSATDCVFTSIPSRRQSSSMDSRHKGTKTGLVTRYSSSSSNTDVGHSDTRLSHSSEIGDRSAASISPGKRRPLDAVCAATYDLARHGRLPLYPRAVAKQLEPILGEVGLDYLVNNAAVLIYDTAFTLDPEELLRVLRTNAAGPALVSQICLPFLEKGSRKMVLHISSTEGSLDTIKHIGSRVTSYAMSKAALNMLALKQKAERPDFIILTMCPGWVRTGELSAGLGVPVISIEALRTDMGGQDAELLPEQSIAGILKIVTSATLGDSGKYLRYNGEVIPW